MHPPLWWLAPPPFPRKRGHYKAPLCCELLMKGSLFRALLSHRSAGGRWCRKAPKGGSHRRWLIVVMLFMTYDTARSSRNADFISIAPKGETTHYILRVASAPSKCVRCAPQSGNPPPFEPFEPSEPSEPSHRRCVQRRQPPPQPSALWAVKLTNPPAHRAGPS